MQYAIAVIRYRKPLDEVLQHLDAHRAYLRNLKESGTLIVSGPFEPRNGGLLVLRFRDGVDVLRELDAIRNNDPYVHAGVAQYEVLPWNPGIGREVLDNVS